MDLKVLFVDCFQQVLYSTLGSNHTIFAVDLKVLFVDCLNQKVVEFWTSRLPVCVHVHECAVFPSEGCVVKYTANSCLL